MLGPVWQKIDNHQEIFNTTDTDEIIVVMPDPLTEGDSGAITQLREITIETMHYSFDSANLTLLVMKHNPQGRIALFDFHDHTIRPFEARWLASKLFTKFIALTDINKIAIYLPNACTKLQIALAEDLYFAGFSARLNTNRFTSCRMIHDEKVVGFNAEREQIRYEHLYEYRRWTNENPDNMTSHTIGDMLHQFAIDHGLEFTKLRTARLEEERMNLLVAVGRASETSPPHLFTVTHNCQPGVKPTVLIGKGITFDTGGINLKPGERYLDTMKNDMGGAALMSNLFMAMVKSGYPHPLVLVIPTCENAISHNSIKPGSIITSRSGKSVIIDNTDAEGRLILADAIHYAEEKFGPSRIITAATLTAASLTQFSNYVTPVHFAPADFRQSLTLSGAEWGEEFAYLEEFLPFKYGNSSIAADLTNQGRLPGKAEVASRCNIAAHFLKQFASVPLIHFDIFCSIWNWSGEYPGATYGSTGAVFNSLYELSGM